MTLIEKTFGRCPYCNNVWVLRIPDQRPKMCPSCKRRFSNPRVGSPPLWATKPAKYWPEKFESYAEVRNRLKELNKPH